LSAAAISLGRHNLLNLDLPAGGEMRPIQEVIRERELQAEKLKSEIEKLREAVRILEEADAAPASPAPAPVPAKRWP
jgi:hypothetical protein